MDEFFPRRNERLGLQAYLLEVNLLKINAPDAAVVHRPVVEPQT